MTQHEFIIVDDTNLDALIAERILKNSGRASSIAKFRAGEDALAHIETKTPASPVIIFLDNRLQGMKGLLFLEKLKNIPSIHPETQVILFISTITPQAEIDEILTSGFVRHVTTKPLTPETLEKLLR